MYWLVTIRTSHIKSVLTLTLLSFCCLPITLFRNYRRCRVTELNGWNWSGVCFTTRDVRSFERSTNQRTASCWWRSAGLPVRSLSAPFLGLVSLRSCQFLALGSIKWCNVFPYLYSTRSSESPRPVLTAGLRIYLTKEYCMFNNKKTQKRTNKCMKMLKVEIKKE